jgi:hypothetical protein
METSMPLPVKAIAVGLCLAGLAQGAAADPNARTLGADLFTTGDSGLPVQAERDVLAAGPTIALEGTVAQDAQIAGLDVEVGAATAGDLTVAGASVSLRGPVGGDLTAAGLRLRVAPGAEVAGNARLVGARVTIDAPITGALAAFGAEVTLNSAVAGDAWLAGNDITFGPAARIDGTLTYSAPEPIAIPASVVAAGRIVYEPFDRMEMMQDMRGAWDDWDMPSRPGPGALIGGFLVTLGFFVAIGALLLTLAPDQVRRLRQRIDARPGMTILIGTLGLSVLFGMVPISVLAVIGIPLVPVVLLTTVAVWTLGYLLGTYALAMRLLRSLGGDENPPILTRLLAVALGVTIAALLNFVPILGWMVNFALVLAGVGAMTATVLDRMSVTVVSARDTEMPPAGGKQG